MSRREFELKKKVEGKAKRKRKQSKGRPPATLASEAREKEGKKERKRTGELRANRLLSSDLS